MHRLYPPIQPYVSHSLQVSERHTLHLEECGNPDGLPVVFLHGGPGGGTDPFHRQFFDPQIYRIVLFDQRGCGKSEPHGELQDNDTDALVADLEAIRTHLGIQRWVVFGGSWGSTLALVYAERHPERVQGLILRGIFLCRRRDIDWFYAEGGASRLFPDHWTQFTDAIPESERDDLMGAYHRRLTGHDEVGRMAAAKAWALWEARCATLMPNFDLEAHFAEPHTALALARIENHYFANDCFLEPDEILSRAARLAGIPGMIVHGRYDAVCPLDQAWALQRVWPDAELHTIADAGHAASEPAIIDALVTATIEMAKRLT